jgi:hypothetical protein
MISASELNSISTEAKNRLDEESAKVEFEKLDELLRVKAAQGWFATRVDHLSEIAVRRLRHLGYIVQSRCDDYLDDYLISWTK